MYSLVVSLFLIMIVARWLGPSGQGAMAAATAWASLFGTLGSLSLGQVAIHRATVRRGESWLAETLGTLLLLAVVVTALCWLVAVALLFFHGGATFKNIPSTALVVAFLLVPFIIWELYGSNLLMATDQLAIYNRAQLVGRTAALLMMFVCWRSRLGVVSALGVSVISQAIVACMGLRKLFLLAGTRVRATLSEARVLLGGALRLHLNAVSSYVLTSLGVLIVNNYRSPAETGWYQFSAALLNVMMVIPASASLVLSVRVAQLGPDRAWAFQRKVMVYLPTVMIGASILAAVCAPFAIPLVVGAKYMPAVPVFRLSLIGLLGVTFSAIMSSQWIGRGYFLLMSMLSIGVALIHLTASVLLVPRYGMYGAVYANLITQTIAIFGNGTLALRCERRFRADRAAESNAVHKSL